MWTGSGTVTNTGRVVRFCDIDSGSALQDRGPFRSRIQAFNKVLFVFKGFRVGLGPWMQHKSLVPSPQALRVRQQLFCEDCSAFVTSEP